MGRGYDVERPYFLAAAGRYAALAVPVPPEAEPPAEDAEADPPA